MGALLAAHATRFEIIAGMNGPSHAAHAAVSKVI
jgi:hypothetical protein